MAVDNNELAGLLANVVKLIADVAKQKGMEDEKVDDLSGNLEKLKSDLTNILSGINDIRDKQLPQQEKYPIEDSQKEKIYLQCLTVLDKMIQENMNAVYPEYNYVRFTVLDKDDYGNITGGELLVSTQMFMGDQVYDFLTTFDIVDGYILEPMNIEHKGQKITLKKLNEIYEETMDYTMEYTDQREARTFLESPMLEGHTVREDRPEQKNYALYNYTEHGNTKIPVQVNKYFKWQQEPVRRNQGLIGS